MIINKPTFTRWTEAAWSAPEAREVLPLPFNVLAGEALDALRFAQRYWNPSGGHGSQGKLPGLVSAVKGGRFVATLPLELEELYAVMQEGQSSYILLSKKSSAAPVDHAEFVLGEMKATLTWLFDDGETTDEDAALEQLSEAHGSAQSHDAIAAALFDYAELADRNRAAINGLGGFDLALIDEARQLGQHLRGQSAGPATPGPEGDVREALLLRNRLATMVYDRILTVRAAARFVFRAHPDIVKEVSSQYQRKRRAVLRGKQKSEDIVEAEVTLGSA